MRYRALLVDVDGTLMCPERKFISPAVMEGLWQLQRRGILVIVATGRGLPAIRPAVMGGLLPDYKICCNGALVVSGDGKAISSHPMNRQQFDAVCRFAREGRHCVGFSFVDGYYTYYRDDVFRAAYAAFNGDLACLCDGTDRTHHLYSGMPYSGYGLFDSNAALQFNTGDDGGIRMMRFRPNAYDICQQRYNKATGAAELIDALGLSWSEMVVIGDGENDIELLRAAGVGVAMGNAGSTIREAADYITGTVLEDGVFQAIQKIF